MVSWLFGRRKREPSKPLAHCAERSPGSLRLEPEGLTVPILVLQADGQGVIAETRQTGRPGQTVIGEYRIGEVAFAFRGTVAEVLALRDGVYHWKIRFVLASL